ncbi:MAG: hypothetical protein P4L53_00290 [Candidatus Obscuribacterales bacterium]|nr:hypothetical protein [Candidatus Obscuribacterales bacterium]
MPDYEKTRLKREAEANARTALEREERRKIEQKERERAKKDHERRHWEGIAMDKKKAAANIEGLAMQKKTEEFMDKLTAEKEAREAAERAQEAEERKRQVQEMIKQSELQQQQKAAGLPVTETPGQNPPPPSMPQKPQGF